MKYFLTSFIALGIALSTILPTISHAGYYSTSEAACQTIDFRNSFPLEMRHQQNLSWCYAHAAADYLQYTYQIPEQISAADIAINYSQSSLSKFINFFRRIASKSARKEPPQTGLIKVAIQKISPQGYCSEDLLPSDEWTRVDSASRQVGKKEILAAILETRDLQKKIHFRKYKRAKDLPFYYSFKQIDQQEFFGILKKSSRASLLLKLRSAACRGKRKPFPRAQLSLDFSIRNPASFKSMNASFNRGMPVTLDFSSTMLKNLDGFKKSIGSLHTVILYGRKYDSETKECTYLLKNSYGSSCEKYDPKLKCEEGYLWIPESKMYRSMTSQLVIKRN